MLAPPPSLAAGLAALKERKMESREIYRKAFELVDPSIIAKRLADTGKVPAKYAAHVTWRDRIVAIVTDADLASAGVTIEQIKESIVFFTATRPTVTRERIAPQNVPGYLVLADGYRNGPAGP